MIVNGSVRPRPRVWMATVDSNQRPSVGRALQKSRIPPTMTFCRSGPTSRLGQAPAPVDVEAETRHPAVAQQELRGVHDVGHGRELPARRASAVAGERLGLAFPERA